MNVTDLIQSYFGGDNAGRLGQAVGLDATLAQKALSAGLPLQLDALADHAAKPDGQKQILEAITNLPQFGSIEEVLKTNEGAGNLQRAGELLAPALFGGNAENIVNSVTRQVGGSVNGVQKLMHMALPLLLSLIGRQGVNMGNVGALMTGLKGGLGSINLGSVAGVASAVAGAAGLGAAGAGAAVGVGAAGGTPSATALLDLLKGQFSGANAEKIGAAAGFSGSTAARAVQGAMPIVLNAIVNKGKTDTGAGDLLKLVGQFGNLSDGNGHLNAGLLGDAAELAKVEGQGRGLLGGLFGNVDEITGRLGTALGGSGANAGRLLALLTPLMLSLLGKRVGSLNASGLSGLLGNLGGHLSGLLPAGLGGLTALLGAGGLAAAATAATPNINITKPDVTVAAATPTVSTPTVSTPTVGASAPTPPATPAPRLVTPPPPPSSTVTTAVTERKGGFPWWWILLPLLLLGGCWLVNQNKNAATTTTSTTTPAGDGTFAITDPAANATLPASDFDLKGTGKAGDEVEVFDGDTSLGKATIGEDGNWSYHVAAPTAGAHTYSVKSADGTELGTVATTIGEAAASGSDTSGSDSNAGAANCTDEYSASLADGKTISEPFEFGGKGQGQGYTVTIKRGGRTIGTKDLPLNSTCSWGYQSKPGAGAITYEVRPMGDAAAEPLSTINLTVQ